MRKIKGKSTGRGSCRWLGAAALTLALSLVLMAPPVQAATVIDFDTDASGVPILAGDIIDNQYALWGVTIKANNYDFGPTVNMAMAFNSEAPTGGDTDLYAPNLGMVLIISEDGDPSDPDDEGSKPAGTIDFFLEFDANAVLMQFLDIEETESTLSFYSGGSLLGSVAIDGGDSILSNVFSQDYTFDHLQVYFQGSGAITSLEVTAVPIPGAILLLGSGLIGMLGLRKKIKA